MEPTFLRKKPLLIPEPGQRVRLRTRRGRWRGSFRAVSYPYTHEQLGVVIRIAEEAEYQEAVREGRRAFGMPWPAHQIEAMLLSEEDADKETQELPQKFREASERAEPASSTGGDQEGSERPGWRRMFGG